MQLISPGFNSKRLLQYAATVILYLLLYRYSNVFETIDIRSTPWNPEKGIAVAAGILLGPIAIPLIMVANFVGNLIWNSSLSPGWGLLSAAAHAVIFSGSASYFSSRLIKLTKPAVTDVLLFIGFALAVTVLSYFIRLGLAYFVLHIRPPYLWQYSFAVSVGNLIGIVTIVPLALILAARRFYTTDVRKFAVGDIALVLSIVPLSYVVFGLKETNEFKFIYMIFIPVVSLAVRRGFAGAVVAIVLADFAMIANLSLRQFEASTALELQVLMLSLALTGLILGAAVSERTQVVEQLAYSNEQLEESQASLLKASRLTLASEMASSMAHEYNQPLSAIRNFVRSARRQMDRPKFDVGKLKSNMDDVVGQIDHLAKLLAETRRFLSKGDMQFEAVDVCDLIGGCVSMTRLEFKRARISVELEVEPDLPLVKAIRAQLQQVLLNLMRNSKEAMSDGQTVGRRIVISAARTARLGFVEFRVSDSGPGIDPELARNLFIPMRTEKIDGLGLGLSLSKSILLNHGGDIWNDSSQKAGTTFAFIVPTADDQTI